MFKIETSLEYIKFIAKIGFSILHKLKHNTFTPNTPNTFTTHYEQTQLLL